MNADHNTFSVNPISALGGAWKLIARNYWLYFGTTSLMLVAACCIPAGGLMVPFLTAGVYAMAFREMRGEPYDLSTAFGGGYKGKSWRIFFAAVISGLPWLPLTIMSQFIDRVENAPQETINAFLIAALVVFIIALLWSITCVFWISLIVDRDVSFAEGFSRSASAAWANSPGLVLLYIAAGMLLIGGALVLCVGVLFVYPLIMVAFAVAHRQVFPDLAPPPNPGGPPGPESYGSLGHGM